MKTFLSLALVALTLGCHLDKLLSAPGGGPRALSTAAPTGLAFTTQPRGTSAGQPLSPDVQVSVVDSAGHAVAGVDTATVVLALAQNPGGATLHGTISTHPQRGVATFKNVSLDNAGNGYTLQASAGGLSAVSAPFDIAPPPPTTGTLAATTSTSANPPATGYTVALDGGTGQSIGASQTMSFPGLSPGTHSVALGSVPSSCTVTGTNPKTVTISASQTTPVTFTITCSAPPSTGSIAVTTSTGGSGLPTNGYSVALDGGAGQSIGINGSVTFSTVTAGSHSVALSGVPANCTVSPGASQTVSVPAGGSVSAPFAISCTAPDVPPSVNAGGNQTVAVGSLPFTLQASFTDPDLDGPWSYTINWGDGSSTTGSASSPGTISQSHTYALTPGTYTITVTVTDGQGISGSDSMVLTVVL